MRSRILPDRGESPGSRTRFIDHSCRTLQESCSCWYGCTVTLLKRDDNWCDHYVYADRPDDCFRCFVHPIVEEGVRNSRPPITLLCPFVVTNLRVDNFVSNREPRDVLYTYRKDSEKWSCDYYACYRPELSSCTDSEIPTTGEAADCLSFGG